MRESGQPGGKEGLSARWLAVTADHVFTVEVLLKHLAIADLVRKHGALAAMGDQLSSA